MFTPCGSSVSVYSGVITYICSTWGIHSQRFHIGYTITDVPLYIFTHGPHGVFTNRCSTWSIYFHMFCIEYSRDMFHMEHVLTDVLHGAYAFICSTWSKYLQMFHMSKYLHILTLKCSSLAI